MDTQNLSAPPCSRPLNPRGVTHINVPHTTRFTVVGNHLAQHRGLSLTAIGLALHIQSLPDEARVDIKTLADRFPEGETRIAAALRELKAHGYLAQVRKRQPNGRVVTHTVSYNQPHAQHPGHGPAPATPEASPRPASDEAPPPPADPNPGPEPREAPAPASAPRPPLPEPRTADLDRHRTATALLATLHRLDPRLLLSERAVRQLAPAVATWLERGARPEAVRHALSSALPEPLRNPAALLAHRLLDQLPPAVPPPRDPEFEGTRPVSPPPLHSCEGCERAIRTPMPGGYCRDCRDAGLGTLDTTTAA